MNIKSITGIFTFLFLISTLNGCSDKNSNFTSSETESESLEQKADYYNVSALEVLNMLYESFEINERGTRDYPDDFAGYYLDGGFGQNDYVLAVMITDESSDRYDFLRDFEKVRFEIAAHSLNEMRELCAEMPPELMKEFGLPYMGAEINMRQNIIEVTFEDTCTDEQKAVVDEYAKDKPITVSYVEKSYPITD